MTSERRVSRTLLREKARPNCVPNHTLDARFGCDESSQVCRSSDVSRSLEPNSRLASTEGCLCHTVRETREEPFERPLPNLIIDQFLQRCVPPGLCGREPDFPEVRANSVCGSWQSWTRSCIARMTSALLRSWSVTNCRDPTATPSVMLPPVTAEILAKLLTSPMFHSSGAAPRSFT